MSVFKSFSWLRWINQNEKDDNDFFDTTSFLPALWFTLFQCYTLPTFYGTMKVFVLFVSQILISRKMSGLTNSHQGKVPLFSLHIFFLKLWSVHSSSDYDFFVVVVVDNKPHWQKLPPWKTDKHKNWHFRQGRHPVLIKSKQETYHIISTFDIKLTYKQNIIWRNSTAV